jgi:hypothetical protein
LILVYGVLIRFSFCIALFAAPLAAQPSSPCSTDRVTSTLVGAGLGAAVAAIPATIAHRHDQNTSHRIVGLSVSAGAVLGLIEANRDRPCTAHRDSLHAATAVLDARSNHARIGGVTGSVLGGVAGIVGSTYLNVGCGDNVRSCNARRNIAILMAGEGALAGGLLGALIGWAWPAGR